MPPNGAAFTRPSIAAAVLHRFTANLAGLHDGALPLRGLLAVNGVLYGTTAFGGSSTCRHSTSPTPGCGTIFSIDLSGKRYRVSHAFPANDLEGETPVARLVYLNGALYGSTLGGGSGCTGYGCGVVFSIGLSGTRFRIVHRFRGADGSAAEGIVGVGSTLYGVTYFGGSPTCNCGVVFSLTPAGAESTVHVFSGAADGRNPIFAPIALNGMLYGTTQNGGGTSCNYYSGYSGCGTLYKVSPSGKGYTVLYRFKGGKDGEFPNNLIAVNGTLYGTTARGGGSGCLGHIGCGTFFKVDTTGKGYAILFRFTGGARGAAPNDVVAQVGNTLYSSTSEGGGTSCKLGCGTVFKIDTSGRNHVVLYSFNAVKDGVDPTAGPIEANGVFYGVTLGGYPCSGALGCGTIYALKR